ncbi:hypothetical protein FCULG_00012840 [Fusarium culmorum]|uniref:Uncharacterized protein n=1 Tax=Fusarium culmorum TaxID=5516 RepID=A0A2T4GG67_FUSCU|nr:hypothetical protein FCULG_00012840 [Fusarium culmorum]
MDQPVDLIVMRPIKSWTSIVLYTSLGSELLPLGFCNASARLRMGYFEVVQDVDDGPFRTAIRDVNPSSSARCLPLVPLARIYSSYAQNLASQIREIPVEGRPALWNCQEYVLEIWDLVWQLGAIDQNTYEVARQNLMPYFGPIQEEDDEYEHEEVPDEDDNQPQFISDSGSD